MDYEQCDIDYTPHKIDDRTFEIKITIHASEHIATEIETAVSNAIDSFASDSFGERTEVDPDTGGKRVVKLFTGNKHKQEKTGNA